MAKQYTLQENISNRNVLMKLFNSELIGAEILISGIKNETVSTEVLAIKLDIEYPLPIPEKILKDFIENLFHHFQNEIINATHKS